MPRKLVAWWRIKHLSCIIGLKIISYKNLTSWYTMGCYKLTLNQIWSRNFLELLWASCENLSKLTFASMIKGVFRTQLNIGDSVFFEKMLNDWKALIILEKTSLVDARLNSKYTAWNEGNLHSDRHFQWYLIF